MVFSFISQKVQVTSSMVLSCGKKHTTNLSSGESDLTYHIFPSISASRSLPERSFKWTSDGPDQKRCPVSKILWLFCRILDSITCLILTVLTKSNIPPFWQCGGDVDISTWGLQWLEKDGPQRQQLESRRHMKVSCFDHVR